MYIRSLPSPVIPRQFDAQLPYLFGRLSGLSFLFPSESCSPEGLIDEIKFVLQSLPPAHLKFLSMLLRVLHNVVKNSEINKMDLDNVIRYL